MDNVVFDTSVWIGLTRRPGWRAYLDILKDRVREGEIRFLIPETVFAEFTLDDPRSVKEARARASSLVKSLEAIGDGADATIVQAIATVGEHLSRSMTQRAFRETISDVAGLMSGGSRLVVTDMVRRAALERMLIGRAPFKEHKASVADVVILEEFVGATRGGKDGDTFAFVTLNHTEFSERGDQRTPHKELLDVFDGQRCTYYGDMTDFMARWPEAGGVDPGGIRADAVTRRDLDEILRMREALEEFKEHIAFRDIEKKILSGKMRIIEDDVKLWRWNPYFIRRTRWNAMSEKAAAFRQGGNDSRLDDEREAGIILGQIEALDWCVLP